ncbi:MAG: cobyric acid synthase [Lachnospiraceae bacterium]|nr:cobyric acid synthase [Lachnospiraceae bacterium]
MKNKTHFIMVQGTMSNAGKSLVVAGLCRIFKEDGYRVSPFKSQNMALNSYITEDGLEMGRAQVMQAEAAGIKPDVHMNPILLKPTDDVGSQVIVNGEVRGNMRAREYFEYKKTLIPDIMNAVSYLSKDNDIIVIEGAGSPAEINLKENDIVNMGMAKMVDAPVILVGDIDRGGVFAQLLGTLELLEEDERKRVKGLVVNKFRGDKSLLDSGIDMLSERGKVPVVGVIPYMDVKLEDEDSLTERFNKKSKGLIDIAVIRLPHISNFTDFDVFEELREVSLRYVSSAKELEDADLIMIPGSKNTISDMKWLRENGFEGVLKKLSGNQKSIFGICGGYQMLGLDIEDKDSVEAGGFIKGLGLLDIHTVMKKEKERKQVTGTIPCLGGPLEALSNLPYEGYEIHMGVSSKKTADGEAISGEKLTDIENTSSKEFRSEEVVVQKDSVYGTYIHGIFDRKEVVKAIIDTLAEKKKVDINTEEYQDYRAFKESQYTKLSKIMREHLDMDAIYEMMDLRK